MSYVIAKKKWDGGYTFIRSLKRDGNIKDLENTIADHKPIFIKEYKTKEAAQSDLEKMKERGYDDYEVIDYSTLQFKYNSRGVWI